MISNYSKCQFNSQLLQLIWESPLPITSHAMLKDTAKQKIMLASKELFTITSFRN